MFNVLDSIFDLILNKTINIQTKLTSKYQIKDNV